MRKCRHYDDTAGLYMATYDAGGSTKSFGYGAAGTNDARDALEMVIAHNNNESPALDFELPYDTVLGRGDWHDVADIYMKWAHKQHWYLKKLRDRGDIPGLLVHANYY